VAGKIVKYRLSYENATGEVKHMIVSVWSQPWLNHMEVTDIREVDEAPQVKAPLLGHAPGSSSTSSSLNDNHTPQMAGGYTDKKGQFGNSQLDQVVLAKLNNYLASNDANWSV